MSQQINLYDPALERHRDWLALHYVAGVAAVLAVLVGALGFVARADLPALQAQAARGEDQLKAAREQITTLGQQVAGRKPDARLEQEIATRRLLLAARGEVLATLRQSLGPQARSFADYLRGFARQNVTGLWLTGFAVDAASGGMEIHGRTLDPALLPEYIRRLDQEKAFEGQTFAALKLDVARPEAPVTGATAQAAARRPPWHEFTLVPVTGDKAAKPAGKVG
jgi:hypothetical protein